MCPFVLAADSQEITSSPETVTHEPATLQPETASLAHHIGEEVPPYLPETKLRL